jgi:sugar O-acyltransferase (sialic acid O-acetyltransferase NeuD family)
MAAAEGGYPIPIPREVVNDESYLVASLLAKAGEPVRAGQPVAELETSKSSFVLYSPADGFFHPDFKPGDLVPVESGFGWIRSAAQADSRERIALSEGGSGVEDLRDRRFSLPAWELLNKTGLSPEIFSGLTQIRTGDIKAYLAAKSSRPPTMEFSADEFAGGVVMLGGGGHCRECLDIVELEGKFRVLGIVDSRARIGEELAGYPILGDNSRLDVFLANGLKYLVLAYGLAGEQAARGRHFRQLSAKGFDFPTLVHPGAAVNRRAKLGRGVQVMAGAMVGSGAVVGDAGIVNSNAVVSHDCHLADNVHVAPGALLAGRVEIGPDTVIGMGATVYLRVRVGSGVIVKNGANLFADVPDGLTVGGEWRGG